MDWERYCLYPGELLNNNRVELLIDGAGAYPAMLEAIASARKGILLDSYIFKDDRIGRRFLDALCDRARAGVDVRVIVDAVGCIDVADAFFDQMRIQGVSVLVYHPLVPWRPGFNLLMRNHRKLLVVDGEVGFIGGINIGDAWLPVAEGGLGWHDIHLRIQGPAVRLLSRLSLGTWRRYASLTDERPFVPDVDNGGGPAMVAVIGSTERRRRRPILRSYRHAIKNSRRYVYIANSYFIPDRGFRRHLANAVARGVDVRVMMPMVGDVYSVQMASRALYAGLLRRGVRVFLWREAVLHAKTAVIDDTWSTVGSFNLDRWSWAMNLEANAAVVDETFSRCLKGVFEADQDRCRELNLAQWNGRPISQRLIEKFFYLFRKFM